MRRDSSGPSSPRWLVACSWAAFLCTIPSALWRVAMIVGLVPDTADLRAFELAGNPALGYAYVFALSVVQLAAGAFTLGLVRPWGERFAGRRVPVWPVVALATLGGLAVVYLFDVAMLTALLQGRRPEARLVHGSALAIMVACYVPIFFGGPLELAATYGYARRRLRDRRHAPPVDERPRASALGR